MGIVVVTLTKKRQKHNKTCNFTWENVDRFSVSKMCNITSKNV